MKKFIKKLNKMAIGAFMLVMVCMSCVISVAQAAETTSDTVPPPNVDELFKPFVYQSGAPSDSKIGIVANIAKGTSADWTVILTAIIQFILAIAGGLAFVSFTVAGVLMVTARGNEEQIKKGKDILLWSILALAIIATSYALVFGISQLKF